MQYETATLTIGVLEAWKPPRARKPRGRVRDAEFTVKMVSVTSEEAPVALVVHEDNPITYRLFNDKLYVQNTSIEQQYESWENFLTSATENRMISLFREDESRIVSPRVVEDNAYIQDKLNKLSAKMILVDGAMWFAAEETPVYYVNATGHNTLDAAIQFSSLCGWMYEEHWYNEGKMFSPLRFEDAWEDLIIEAQSARKTNMANEAIELRESGGYRAYQKIEVLIPTIELFDPQLANCRKNIAEAKERMRNAREELAAAKQLLETYQDHIANDSDGRSKYIEAKQRFYERKNALNRSCCDMF